MRFSFGCQHAAEGSYGDKLIGKLRCNAQPELSTLSVCDVGVVLAYSNSVAGKLADYTQQRGMGNIGCFYGGMVAVTLAGLMLFLCSKFGDLGKEELVVTKKAGANLKPGKA